MWECLFASLSSVCSLAGNPPWDCIGGEPGDPILSMNHKVAVTKPVDSRVVWDVSSESQNVTPRYRHGMEEGERD